MSYKVLIIDDNVLFLNLMKEQLNKLRVTDVTTMPDAHKLHYVLQKHIYDIIFVDINMPTLCGLTCIKLIRHSEKTLHRSPVKIMVMSADTPCLADEYEEFIDAFIEKPFSLNELNSVIRKLHLS